MGVACVVGVSGCGESTSTDVDPPPQTPAQPDRLLTDEELRTLQATVEVPIDSAWAAWTVANHHPVRSLTVDDDFSDLAFFEDYIGDRRFVQLGESGHGVSEFSTAKVRLIKYLHEPGTSWMFGTFPTRAWGLNTELIVPRAEYDGVLFIHTVNPPGYV